MARDRVAPLFDLPPEEFTAARDRLAADLRAAGKRDAAAEVKALRRPTVPAWAVNQVARRHRAEVQELLAVGGELREAQRTALSGGRAEELAHIGARRRRVVDRLVTRAGSILRDAGRPDTRATLDRVADTLLAATVDEEAAGAVVAGRLERELASPSGFEAALGDLPAASSGRTAKRRDPRAGERLEGARRKARQAREEADEAQREARRLADEAEAAGRAARRAEQRAVRAGERADEAERAVEALAAKVSRR